MGAKNPGVRYGKRAPVLTLCMSPSVGSHVECQRRQKHCNQVTWDSYPTSAITRICGVCFAPRTLVPTHRCPECTSLLLFALFSSYL